MRKLHQFRTASRLIGAAILLATLSQASPARANGALNIPLITTAASSLPVEIVPADTHIRYGGRFDYSDPAGPQCEWSGSSETIEFTGTSLNVRLKEVATNNEYEIVVDGQITAVLVPLNGINLYNIFSSGTSGTHIVSIVRRTEAFYLISQFEGFQMSSGGALLTLPASNGRGIEIVGDSISCGYANEAANQNQTLTTQNEDAYLAYGFVAARALGADYADIAWSGRKMWPDNTVPSIYDLINPTNTTPNWNFSWVPGAVIINLSTNDFGSGNPDETSWTTAYEAFITHLRTHYPNAMIYCATSPMAGGTEYSSIVTYLQKIVQDKVNAGDNKVKILSFATQDGTLGYGGDWHPSLEEDQLMAGVVLSALQTDLGWTITAVPPAPISLAATIPGNGVTLNWNAAGYASTYSIKRSTANGGPYTAIGTATSPVASYSDTSTTNGVTYYYVVSGTNSAGTGPNSAQVSATPQPAPTFTSSASANPASVASGNVTVVTLSIKDTAAVGLTNGNVLLQITDSGNNIVASNTWPNVNFSAGQTLPFTYNWTASVATGTYTINIGVFDAGWTTGYHWNGAGGTITVTAGTGPPPVPTGLAAAAGNAQVSLSWNASTNATAYDVKRSTVSGSGYVTVSSPATTIYTNTGLTNGVTYYFVVDAKNANGASANSTQVSATPTNVTSPYGGTAWAIPGTVQSENYDLGGETIAYHDTDAVNNGGQYRTAEGVDVETCTDTGTGYDVGYVAAGEWMKYTCSVASTGTYNIGFRVAGTASGTCHLEDTSGTNLTGAVTTPNTGGWQTWQTVTVNNVSLTAGSHVLKFVADTAGYNINYISFAFAGGAPPVPTGLTATGGNAQIALTWNASSGATAYDVKRSTVSGSGYATVSSPTVTNYTNTGLTNGTTYYFVVDAKNAGGTSANSAQVSATPSAGVPPVPTGLAGIPTDAQIALTWNASAGATAYDVKRSTVSGSGYVTVSSPTTTSYTNTGLTDSTAYYYVVAAKNASGSSANSAQISGIPAQYNFESGVQGFTFNLAPITGVAQSSTQAFGVTHSLAVTINGAAGTSDALVASPTTTAGKVVSYRVWVPSGSQVTQVQPYVLQGAAGGWLWTGNIVPIASLTTNAWNTIQVTVPANAAMPLYQLGVEFKTGATWSGTCYVDSISW